MKKSIRAFIALLLCLLGTLNLLGQNLSFGPDVQISEDENVAKIAKFWWSYIISQSQSDYNITDSPF